MLRAGVSD